ncbi:MAG TPA: cytochrome c3 family protein [Pelovirga sp.]|nr:cytochrome c3 family protein [Pelovirga sp.]
MKKIAVLLVVLAVVGFAVYAVAAPPKEVVYEVKMGNVTYDHQAHTGLGASCKDCHHTGEMVSCKDCHNKTSKPSNKDAFHGMCIDCHKEQAAGPTKCTECHIR